MCCASLSASRHCYRRPPVCGHWIHQSGKRACRRYAPSMPGPLPVVAQTAAIYPREYVQQGWKRSSPCSKLLQGIPAIAAGETQQRGLEALADYQYLEQFAHLSLGNQLLHRRKRGCHVWVASSHCSLKQLRQPRVQQKPGLIGITEYIQPAFQRGISHGGKVHVSGDVLDARQHERFVVAVMTEMTHQGAGKALGMIVLALREAIVNEQCSAGLQPTAQLANPGFRLQIDF